MVAEESSDPEPHLHGVYAGIWRSQACIGDVHVAQFETHVVVGAEDVYAERGLVGEVYSVGAGGTS